MKKRIINLLKVIGIVCITILIIELIYIVFIMQDKSIYFDSINSVVDIGNGYVIGGSNNNNDKFFEKAKLTKYNLKKEKKFEVLYNKGFNGSFFDVIQDGEDFIAVGSYEATEEEYEKGVRTALITKYDKDGNLLYENSFQVLGNSKFTSVSVVDDGYVVTGQSVYEDMVVGLSDAGGAFVIKYNKELELDWKSNYGDSKTAIYNDAFVIDDNIYAVGVTDSVIGVVAQYNFDGEVVKSTEYEYTDSFGFTGVTYLNDNLYISASKKVDDSTQYDAALIQYDMNLEFKKDVIYDDNEYERYNRVIIDDNENIVVVGTSAGVDKKKNNKNVNVFEHDGIIAKYDKNLEKISIVLYGDDRDDYFTDIILSDGNYIVSGYSSYEDGSYLSKFITYSDSLKVLEVR